MDSPPNFWGVQCSSTQDPCSCCGCCNLEFSPFPPWGSAAADLLAFVMPSQLPGSRWEHEAEPLFPREPGQRDPHYFVPFQEGELSLRPIKTLEGEYRGRSGSWLWPNSSVSLLTCDKRCVCPCIHEYMHMCMSMCACDCIFMCMWLSVWISTCI